MRRHHDGMASLPKDVYVKILMKCMCNYKLCLGFPKQIVKNTAYALIVDFNLEIRNRTRCEVVPFPTQKTRVIYQMALLKYENTSPYYLDLEFNGVFITRILPLCQIPMYDEYNANQVIPTGGGYMDKYINRQFQSSPLVLCENGGVTPTITLTIGHNENIYRNGRCLFKLIIYHL